MLVHATCVGIGEIGVLIRGPSGSGKSALALRLIDVPGFGVGTATMQARLVADDQVSVEQRGERLWASAPDVLAGKLEVRGLGIIRLEHLPAVQVRLVVELLPLAEIERMPEPSALQTNLACLSLPRLALSAIDPAAPARLRAALGHFGLV